MSFPLQYLCITHVCKYIYFWFLYLVSEQGSWHAEDMSKATNMEILKSKEGSVRMSYQILTTSNYTGWLFKMKVYMQEHGIWEAIKPKNTKEMIEDKTDISRDP